MELVGERCRVTKGNHWKDTGEVTEPAGSLENPAQKTEHCQRKLGRQSLVRVPSSYSCSCTTGSCLLLALAKPFPHCLFLDHSL